MIGLPLFSRRGAFCPSWSLPGAWLIASALTLAGCTRPTHSPVPSDAKTLYAANCASCHGEDGRNDRQGANPAMRLMKANALSDKEWEALVQNGRSEMPAFHNRLSPQEIHALRVYIRQLTSQ